MGKKKPTPPPVVTQRNQERQEQSNGPSTASSSTASDEALLAQAAELLSRVSIDSSRGAKSNALIKKIRSELDAALSGGSGYGDGGAEVSPSEETLSPLMKHHQNGLGSGAERNMPSWSPSDTPPLRAASIVAPKFLTAAANKGSSSSRHHKRVSSEVVTFALPGAVNGPSVDDVAGASGMGGSVTPRSRKQTNALLPPDLEQRKKSSTPSKKQQRGGVRSRSTSSARNNANSSQVLNMSFSSRLYEQVVPPAKKATRRLIRPKRNWVILFLCMIIVALVWHRQIEMPTGLIVDDPNRPGVLFDKGTIKIRRPVAMVPGFITSALELWENDECATTFGPSGTTLFRERMFGPQMIFNLLKKPRCYMRQFGLSTTEFGGDPEPFNTSSGQKIRVRPAGWLDSGDYFITGFWVWAKLIRSLADIGYDPNDMVLFPFDWRLSGTLAEKRDGYFHRMQSSLEEMFRLSGGIKIVVVSHSYGGPIKNEFFHWVEQRVPGWTNQYIHSLVFIGAPMLGLPKALSALVSGEMRDMTSLPSVPRNIFNAYIPRTWRTETFRSWPCLEMMLPRGCDAMWPNVMTLFNQSVSLRASDAFELVETVSTQAGDHSLAGQVRVSKRPENRLRLPHLPKAPDMKAYVFYGTGLATEVGYAYTIDEDDVGGVEAAATALGGSLALKTSEIWDFIKAFRFDSVAAFTSSLFAGNNAAADMRAKYSGEHSPHHGQGDRHRANTSHKHLYSAPVASPFDSVPADGIADPTTAGSEGSLSVPNSQPRAPTLTWAQYVASLGDLVRDVGNKVIDDSVMALKKLVNDNDTTNDAALEAAAAKALATTTAPSAAAADDDDSLSCVDEQSGINLVKPGGLWRTEFLGSRTTGNALMVDTSINSHINPQIAAQQGLKKLRGGGDMRYHQGVLLGAGDATVPLISLGFMARSPNGFAKDVGSVLTKEFVHLHTKDDHDKLMAVKAERLRRSATRSNKDAEGGAGHQPVPNIGITTKAVAADAVLPEHSVVVGAKASSVGSSSSTACETEEKPRKKVDGNLFSDYLTKLSDLNVSRLLERDTSELDEVISGAANTLYSATDNFLAHLKDNVKAVLDVRGGQASSDHVDLMGNYELLTDVLNIVTGNEDKITERIFTDIDDRVAALPCYKARR